MELIPHDISEGGLSIEVESKEQVEEFIEKREFEFRLETPIKEAPQVSGSMKLVNIMEMPDKFKLGFETFMEDADMVKLRFYIYQRIKEMLSEE